MKERAPAFPSSIHIALHWATDSSDQTLGAFILSPRSLGPEEEASSKNVAYREPVGVDAFAPEEILPLELDDH